MTGRQLGRREFVAAGMVTAAGAARARWCRASAMPLATELDSRSVVLYSSVDDALLREVVELFHKSAAGRFEVKLVGDTEATKTTGLVQRLIAERESPRGDVWWSSEALGTAMLAREGVLDPFRPKAIEQELPEGQSWPQELVQERWTGFACRARVMVVNTKRVAEADRPARLRELVDPGWRGRIGLARPQFGTTRGEFAALLAANGEEAFGTWLRGLKANDAKLFDGNATVVRACASGEIDVGLTDTDDVWAGRARGWPVAMVFPAGGEDAPQWPRVDGGAGLVSKGPLLIPNTVGLVHGGPNAEGGRALIEFLLGAEVERSMAHSESKNLPARPGLAAEFPQAHVPAPWCVDWTTVLQSLGRAMAMADECLPS